MNKQQVLYFTYETAGIKKGGGSVLMKKYPKVDMAETGRRIRELMNMKGLCVKDIQEALGLSTPQSIYHWFGGRNLPTVDNLYALSELLELPVDILIKGNRRYQCTLRNTMYRRLYIYREYLPESKAV